MIDKLTRTVRAASLRPSHIGRHFVGYGVLTSVRIDADGYEVTFDDGLRLRGGPNAPMSYWIDESVLGRRS